MTALRDQSFHGENKRQPQLISFQQAYGKVNLVLRPASNIQNTD
jgi:hypothetical protein